MVFAVERKITTKGVVEASYEDALKLVHDHGAMITLNPLVVNHQPHPTEPDTHVITDKLKILGFTKLQSYKARVEKVDDGITFHVDAGPVTSVNHWRLKRVAEDGGKVEVTEEANVKTSILLMGYVASSIKQSHTVLMERLKSTLEGKEAAPS